MALASSAATLAINAAVTDVTHAQLHTGPPGSAGTANQFAVTVRQATDFAAGAAGAAAANVFPTWLALASAGTLTHISLWTAVTGGTYRGSAVLSAAKVVSIGDDFSLTAITMSISHDG